jgi:transcription initiation factor TFIIIB Brf1 subunit/transcription initiation factor TFIIB
MTEHPIRCVNCDHIEGTCPQFGSEPPRIVVDEVTGNHYCESCGCLRVITQARDKEQGDHKREQQRVAEQRALDEALAAHPDLLAKADGFAAVILNEHAPDDGGRSCNGYCWEPYHERASWPCAPYEMARDWVKTTTRASDSEPATSLDAAIRAHAEQLVESDEVITNWVILAATRTTDGGEVRAIVSDDDLPTYVVRGMLDEARARIDRAQARFEQGDDA